MTGALTGGRRFVSGSCARAKPLPGLFAGNSDSHREKQVEWLQQNWINLLVLAGVILFLRLSGMGCGFGGRRVRPQHRPDRQAGADTPAESATTTDPVSRRPVDPTSAVATVYQGRAYYFESRENRDRFEAAPDQYATVPQDDDQAARHRHHGGCC